MEPFFDPVLKSMSSRRSVSKVGGKTPSDQEIKDLLAAVTPVADHKALRPWRIIAMRGEARARLGAALDAAEGIERAAGERNDKPFRAELLIALVLSPKEHPKVPEWEQLATAAGAGHLLELALWQKGWGVMWRTGLLVDDVHVREVHNLLPHEKLLGWLYVGDIDERFKQRLRASSKPPLDPEQFFSALE